VWPPFNISRNDTVLSLPFESARRRHFLNAGSRRHLSLGIHDVAPPNTRLYLAIRYSLRFCVFEAQTAGRVPAAAPVCAPRVRFVGEAYLIGYQQPVADPSGIGSRRACHENRGHDGRERKKITHASPKAVAPRDSAKFLASIIVRLIRVIVNQQCYSTPKSSLFWLFNNRLRRRRRSRF